MKNINKVIFAQKQIIFNIVLACLTLLFFFLCGKINAYATEETLALRGYINEVETTEFEDTKPGNKYKLWVDVESSYEKDPSKINYKWYIYDAECTDYVPYCDENNVQYTENNIIIQKKGLEEQRYQVTVQDGKEEQKEWFLLSTNATLEIEGYINGKSYIGYENYTISDTDKPIILSVTASSTLGKELKYTWERGKEVEYGDIEYTTIPQENTNSYTVNMSKNAEIYHCIVTDGVNERELVFKLKKASKESVKIISSSVKVKSQVINKNENDNYYHIKTGDEVELQVEAENLLEDSNLIYEWYDNDYDLIDDRYISTDKTKCIITIPQNMDMACYECRVINNKNNYAAKCWFVLQNDTYKADATEFELYIDGNPKSSLTLDYSKKFDPIILSVKPTTENVDAEDFKYQWKIDGEEDILTSEEHLEITQAFIENNNLNNKDEFLIAVKMTNKLNSKDVSTYFFGINKPDYTRDFYSYIGEELTSNANVKKGEKITLKVIPAKGEINEDFTYQWCDSDYNAIPYANKNEYTITKSKGKEKFYCVVSCEKKSTAYDFMLYEKVEESCQHQLEKVEKQVSTCRKAGHKEYWRCKKCSIMFGDVKGKNETTIKAVTLPLANHTVVVDPAVAPTETTLGKTEGKHCSVCNTVLVAQKVIPATGKLPSGNNKPSNGNSTQQNLSLKTGIKVTDKKSKAVYKVNGNKTVEYNKVDKKAKKATVPSMLIVNGVKYQVTSIAPKAFANNKNLKKIVVPSSVINIGKRAFCGCKNLKTIIIKTPYLTKKSIGSNAFKGIHAKATIKVPKKQKKLYQRILKFKGVGKNMQIK